MGPAPMGPMPPGSMPPDPMPPGPMPPGPVPVGAGPPPRPANRSVQMLVVAIVAVFAVLSIGFFVALLSASRNAKARSGGAAIAASWTTVATPDGTLRFSFPGDPEITNRTTEDGTRITEYATRTLFGQYGLRTDDFTRGYGGVTIEQWFNGLPADFARDVQGKVTFSTRTDVHGKPAITFQVKVGADTWHVTSIFLGTRLIEVWAMAPDTAAADLDRILGSLELLDPRASPTTTA